ncbi:MAG TPA: NADH-quinone oxidoreductase subunit NuoK, partial [Polyangiaceae bacterium]|nr:NADH-quinone oxidoreductase subunit NuoK [Polyangiaceae bacterium]
MLGYDIGHYLFVGFALFVIGAVGFLVRRNVLVQLMAIELMLNSVNLNLVGFSRFVESPNAIDGQVFAIFIITVAAAEAAVALALAVS